MNLQFYLGKFKCEYEGLVNMYIIYMESGFIDLLIVIVGKEGRLLLDLYQSFMFLFENRKCLLVI